MGLRFFRRMKIAPGLTLNLSKSGGSVSMGVRGARVTVGPRGVRPTVGLPGTGLYYTTQISPPKNVASKPAATRSTRRPPAEHDTTGYEQSSTPPNGGEVNANKLEPGFFQRLLMSNDEKDFVDGMRLFTNGDNKQAYQFLSRSSHIADALFMAGILALQLGEPDRAVGDFENALQNKAELGKKFAKYSISANVELPITPQITIYIQPTVRGVVLALVEAYQRLGQWGNAVKVIDAYGAENHPDDLVLLLSLVELLAAEDTSTNACKRVVDLTKNLENIDSLHTAILYWKAVALSRLGLDTAACDILTSLLRQKKGREVELLLSIQYQRALCYQKLGKKALADKEYEKIYSQSPNFEDVSQRLGLNT